MNINTQIRNIQSELTDLKKQIIGDLYIDAEMRILYATDASIYREWPLAVARPKNVEDIQLIIQFCKSHQLSIIPRAAGTSLAGQCVGSGIVVDISKYFTEILELNVTERWVKVQPGVIRDELNEYLKPHGLFFSPITSTANRAMIGGMVGNNSCGTTSIVYGSTRDHVIELTTILSNGSKVIFGEMTQKQLEAKLSKDTLEGHLYRHMVSELNQIDIQNNIKSNFPKESIHRRNTGYAVDYLLKSEIFSDSEIPFNFCKLLCGSEGTLAFTTEIKLGLDPLPEPYDVVVAAHFESIHDCMKSTQFAMKHHPSACELMDKIILDCTKENIEQSKNRDFVVGDPKGVLLIEFRGQNHDEAIAKAHKLIADLTQKSIGYAYPIILPPKTKGVWALRSAGLGLLSNMPGDKKATTCIEDTAVALEDLADYIDDVESMLSDYGQESVYYAHAGAGEIHLRPILDLRKGEGQQGLLDIATASAHLVKKYNGSLSGEHGDGRLRAQFIPLMVGPENYELFRRVKNTWDPQNLFNPGKIVDAPPMNSSLRYSVDHQEPEIKTLMDFSKDGGILRSAEKCNGSGDCRKLPLSGGTMCPSYMATRDEKDTTRARANILREFLTQSTQVNKFAHEEIKNVMDLCLSCKGCTSECPSGVDMAGLKAEFLYQYQKTHGIPFRSKMFGYINDFNQLGGYIPSLYNFGLTNPWISGIVKKILKVAPQRTLPTIHKRSLYHWYQSNYHKLPPLINPIKSVYLFCDEFTNWNDTTIGIKAIQLLHQLGYNVMMIDHPESGRAAISKGLLIKAQKVAEKNVAIFGNLINNETPLLGIEPSSILSFRDEYSRLVPKELIESAIRIKENTFLIEEFMAKEIQSGHIRSDQFSTKHKIIKLHGHCHQKALSRIEDSIWALSIPKNHTIELIPSGCCGMAGSFGYEAEHYAVSQQIGELVLFPAVRAATADTIIAASGTSCRHQIWDGTQRKAFHPVEILFDSLIFS